MRLHGPTKPPPKSVTVGKLYRGRRFLAHCAARQTQGVRLPPVSVVARDHAVPNGVPRGRPGKRGTYVPESGADPRRPQQGPPVYRVPVAHDSRQRGPQGNRTVQLDEHHPGIGPHFQKS